MEDVDLRRLTKDEREQYARYTHMNNLPTSEQLRAHGPTFIALAVWMVLVIGLFVGFASAGRTAAGSYSARDNPDAAMLLVLALVVMLGGIPVVIMIAVRVGNSALARYRAEFLKRIGYESRPTRTSPTTSSYDESTKSLRQLQHEWYEGHSELDWRDRERAEMYGIDVDTYINNVLENDKD
ncbi:MAG: hypothetical protein ABS64_00405 [Microbacterium sp. SCN 69-37]|nr:MAG: hypothetical protein ABS64_00405 [Microbacterium sp. SCN 69-37]